ncbi:hypothetical protein [uncultured Draconibacterium sp.]|uniref:hypothetical protein n=1 Tax=uncultured Draconibacterium sp. TaxID=1573823 RepID=UPI0032163CD4
MKNFRLSLVGLVLLFITNAAIANEPADYFVGDWKVEVKGTPNGDATMVMHLERKEGKLTGEMRTEGTDPAKLTQVDEKEGTITVYYNSMGYDINFSFTKVDENKIKGSLMEMFEATGERILK